MVSLTFSWTTEAAVVMKASLLEFGIAPVDHDVPVFQLPDPPSQLSGVTVNGWAKGWTAKGCTAKPFPRISRRRACCPRSEEHTSELQSPCNLACRLLLEKKQPGRHQPRGMDGHERARQHKPLHPPGHDGGVCTVVKCGSAPYPGCSTFFFYIVTDAHGNHSPSTQQVIPADN